MTTLKNLLKKAHELTGINVRYQSFYDLDKVELYDGIWACASLLHCERDRLTEVLQKNALCAKTKWRDLHVI